MGARFRAHLALLSVAALLWTAPAPAADTDPRAGAADAQGEQAPRRGPRLRFKDGPLCMCVNGTSEADIRAAEQARRRAAQREQRGRQEDN